MRKPLGFRETSFLKQSTFFWGKMFYKCDEKTGLNKLDTRFYSLALWLSNLKLVIISVLFITQYFVVVYVT